MKSKVKYVDPSRLLPFIDNPEAAGLDMSKLKEKRKDRYKTRVSKYRIFLNKCTYIYCVIKYLFII